MNFESSAASAARVVALVLCAGRSTRMHPLNKLVTPIDGVPLAARAVDAVLRSPVCEVIVVTGHDAEALRAALGARAVRYVHNAAFASGVASSIQAGVAALPADADGALICLGDMPRMHPEILRQLFDAFEAEGRQSVCVPVAGERRGNPVLWPRWAFEPLRALRGDVGGRALFEALGTKLTYVPVPDDACFEDLDTPEAFVGGERGH